MNAFELTCKLVRNCLQLRETEILTSETQLIGGFAEFNSLTITTLVMEIEEYLDCQIADNELKGEIFETVGSLTEFIQQKMEYA